MIVDTSALLAFFNTAEPQHTAVVETLTADTGDDLVVSPYVIAELDYLLATRVGTRAEVAALNELASGAWELGAFSSTDVAAAAAVVANYADQQIGLTDASLVVLAHRYGTPVIATLDHRHFNALRTLDGHPFQVLPL